MDSHKCHRLTFNGYSAIGNATQRKPMFAGLSSPIMQELFNPPFSKRYNSTTTPFQYDDYALRYIIAFLAVPTAVALFLPFLGMDPLRKLFVFAVPKTWRIWTPSLGSWRPSVFGLGFLLFLTLTTACLMALVTTLAYVSQIDDPNPEREFDAPLPLPAPMLTYKSKTGLADLTQTAPGPASDGDPNSSDNPPFLGLRRA